MTDVMIEAKGLTKTYGPVAALTDANFEIRKGEILGFLGPNGAGKTTTMKILTCFISPSSGSAKVNGSDVFEDPLGVRRAIGYLPESTPLYTEMLVLEYLEFIAKMRGFRGPDVRKAIKRAVEQTSLGDVIAKEIRQLSKGFRQRVGIAQALIHEPPILILDEPMSGLDPNQASEIRQVIRDIGAERTVILSTHNLAEVETTCNRVLIIARGKIVADDTPEDLAARAGKARVVATLQRPDAGRDSSAVRDLFAAISGVDSVRVRAGEDDELVLDVVPEGDLDLRAEVFRTAASNDLVLLGLERQSENLEDIFRQLTTTGGN